ncbi:IS3 family transposase [Paenibacillus dendritiformis]
MAALLRMEQTNNHKRVQRIMQREQLQCRTHHRPNRKP